MLLELQNISKSFYRKTAVHNVSLKLHEGEIFGLLGPNGAGKTTLIRIINQIVEPDHGSIRFKKAFMKEQDLSQIGYLPEERGLYKSMTVKEHAYFLGLLRGMSKREVRQQFDLLSKKFEIDDWKDKRIEELSKGMAQKVQFVCAILHDPELLILDEPFSGFDPVNVDLIQKELIKMKARGKTILLSTHNMKSVEEICDRVALINNSKKIVESSVSELKSERKTGLYRIRFKGNMISLVNALWTGFELVDKSVLGEDRFEALIKMRGNHNFQDLLKTLIGQIEIEAAEELLPSMQDVFMELVKG
ncbi:MAG: ABC transporter ATP-binding protein [Bacteroidetes bacterium]|nr:MAG: ABC transporter ATP-binding protein [Bacteroidota bacterium]